MASLEPDDLVGVLGSGLRLLVAIVVLFSAASCATNAPRPSSPPENVATAGSAESRPQRDPTKDALAKKLAKEIAYEAYPQWAAAHPNKPCPDAPADLAEYLNDTRMVDPWGSFYRFLCGPTMPQRMKGVLAVSAGADGKFDTSDDIRSSDE